MDTNEITSDFINSIIYNVKKNVIETSETAYILDPVFKIVRNRVNAEVVKTLIRMGKDEALAKKIIRFIVSEQDNTGFWNEIHPNYNQPSALITSIIGDSLILGSDLFPNAELKNSINLAKDYVISQENNGIFLKSETYTADHLNVDATCGAFLAKYGKKYDDNDCADIAIRTAKHICNNQSPDGSFPYTTNKGNYSYNLNIPCVHYQGVTLYYLTKIHEVIGEDWLKNAIIKGCEWLSGVQKDRGKFNWSKSGLMFAYYLSGAYAFAFSSFKYASSWDKKYLENANKSLDILKDNTHGIMLRWEKDNWLNFPSSIHTTFNTAFLGDYPYNYKLFRLGYGFYRQAARRRFSKEPDEKVFKKLVNILNLNVSTVESFSNYPDMFMTSEVLDCLSYSVTIEHF